MNETPIKQTAMQRVRARRAAARSDAMVRRHANSGNTSVRTARARSFKSIDPSWPKFGVSCIAGPTRWYDTQAEADQTAANLNAI